MKNHKASQVTVTSDAAGQRIDNFLLKTLKDLPKSRIYRMLRSGEVRVNRGRTKPTYRLNVGDIVRIPPFYEEERQRVDCGNLRLEVPILYEDESFMVINKPAGIAVHGGSGVSLGIIESLRQQRGQHATLELVHRLDKDTSGCLLIAKKRSQLRYIQDLFREGQVTKEYWALVKGHPQQGVIDQPLKRGHLSSGERFVRVQSDGQPSLTQISVLEHYQETSLVLAQPKTGRTHQIRVHLSFIGNPIVGDIKYGDRAFNQSMKKQGLKRLFLHARRIAFRLPSGEAFSQEAPLDLSWNESLQQLEG